MQAESAFCLWKSGLNQTFHTVKPRLKGYNEEDFKCY